MADESIELDSMGNIKDFCEKEAQEIELEIERMGIVLGVDWNDGIQVQKLAKESLSADEAFTLYEQDLDDYQKKAKVTLFALASMMLDLMAKSANKGIHTHGGVAWKAFSRELMKERGIPILESEPAHKSGGPL
jgi:hypothetical protein